MSPRAAFLSFRYGPTDGVSVVTRTWIDAFERIGFDTVTVAGAGDADRLVEGFGLDDPPSPDTPPPDEIGLRAALDDVDLVVVENLLTIPMNLAASRVAARVLAGRPALVHHHDPPWHRQRFAHVTELPATDPAWRHVAITRTLADELAARDIDATVVYNGFAPPPPRPPAELAELRDGVRSAIDVKPTELLVVHPVRAIERKNLPAAITLAEQLGATYWLLGPAEEGYEVELRRLLGAATCRVVHRAWPDADGFYAAADHVAFPSTWEGFGNPPIEAALRRRTVSVGSYSVADELRAHGFEWFDPSDVDGIGTALAGPSEPTVTRMLDVNERIARDRFGLDGVRSILHDLLDEAGWLP